MTGDTDGLGVDRPRFGRLTHREAHLFELGIWPGASVALALLAGDYLLALATVSLIRRRMQRTDREPSRPPERPALLRAYVRDAWYFAVGALTGFAVVFAAGLVAGGAVQPSG
ncbi:hypothetical protein [Haloarchaeobius baliensis]|uniref:hypothetical protein n=1 Tax=Haloarchaeobius baliensis TaxID=1670458 RepID=UPI003F882174